MDETANLSLPLLQAAQAQKHVTMNEALTRLDVLVNLTLQSVSVTSPPASATDGLAWGVPAGAVDAWSGRDGLIAMADNGGWAFGAPAAGWRAWVMDQGHEVQHDGSGWRPAFAARAASGAGLRFRVLEFDHEIVAGGTQSSALYIPSHVMVFGVTGRVIEAITGSLSNWRLGADGSDNRFGSGLGLGKNSYVHGVLGAPLTGYAPMPLDLTPESGAFAGGVVRLAVHYAELALPAAV
ncbi:uncharacterized protein DUF2793 [Rhodovulum bhavnagarense]|uniref:Uncharacterized protein DUF2793 n=1 Tax=Rhodovulum bhavnagarense TaxID=992286 RepID=A0A4R2RG72_9RHOB|nr:DUF2793 domain-containing protein [Rhodovulum bhavnagarense]TCP61933.1 uncharacterized protein DUF2793 [Rhodovulum bhavnagarense]